MLPSTLTFIDIETTGLSAMHDRIIEVGIVRVENGEVAETYSTLVNPECSLPRDITVLTGIYAEQLENAPTFYDIRDHIKELLCDSIFVAHNARFDYSFIRSEFKRLDETFKAKTLCTATLSRKLFPGVRGHSLDSIIKRFNLPVGIRHRAMADAMVLWEFIKKINNGQLTHFDMVVKTVLKSPTLPPGISEKYIGSLPEAPGVYIFYNADGTPIYIGKSTNLKDRVLSHFQNSLTDQKDARIFQRIASLECIRTEGELGALLMESRLIKQNKPLYNRMLRNAESLTGLVEHQTPQGYFSIKTKELSEISSTDITRVLAVFKTQKQLRTALHIVSKEFKLCKKLLGQEKTKGACFGSQLETCNGACIGKEHSAVYNLRFREAFRKTKIRQWPYKEPIVLSEGKTGVVVSHWCIVGTIDLEDLKINMDTQVTFDYDAYKILSSYLLRKQNLLKIHPLSSLYPQGFLNTA